MTIVLSLMYYVKIPIEVLQGLEFKQEIVYVVLVSCTIGCYLLSDLYYVKKSILLKCICGKDFFLFFLFVTLYTTYRMLKRVFLKLCVK